MECGKCGNNMSFETSQDVSYYWCWCCGNRIYTGYPRREAVEEENKKGVVLNRDRKGSDKHGGKRLDDGSTKAEDYQEAG